MELYTLKRWILWYLNYTSMMLLFTKQMEPKNSIANIIFVQLFCKLDQLFLYDKSLKTKSLGLMYQYLKF